MKLDLIRKEDGMHWECNRSHWECLIQSAEKSGYKAQGTTQYDFDTGEPDDDWIVPTTVQNLGSWSVVKMQKTWLSH